MSQSVLFIGTPGILLYSTSIKKALENLGLQIYEPEYPTFKDQNALQKRLSRKKFLSDFFHVQNQKYIEALNKYKPDFIFVINNSRMNGEFLQYANKQQIPVYMYCIDSIRWCDKALEHMQYYDEIFSYEPSDSEIEFRPGKFVKFLPLGFDSDIYKPNHSITDKEYDLCFVGRLDKRRLSVLEKAAEYAYKNKLKFAIYTSIQLFNIPHFWLIPKLLARRIKYNLKYKYLMKYIINRPIIGDELTALYNNSKICLNIHVGTHAGMHTGPNPRTFELLGCQAFEIIDSGHLGKTILKSKQHLVEFTDENDLLDKIDYYLQHSDERLKIAAAGYSTTRHKYELSILMKEAIRYIK